MITKIRNKHQVFLACLLSLNSFSQVSFQKTYGSTISNGALKIVATVDKGFACVGTRDSSGLFILKTDSLGNTQWSTSCFGLNYLNSIFDIVESSSGGFAIVGNAQVAGTSDAFLMRIDAAGTIKWIKTFGGSYQDYAYGVCETDDAGFAITGDCESFPAPSSKAFLIKTDSSGNLLLGKVYGDISTSRSGNSIKRIRNNSYLIGGSISDAGAGGMDGFMMLVDSNGTAQWQKTFGGAQDDYIDNVEVASNNEYFACGLTNSFGFGGYDAYLIKVDSTGNAIWTRTYGSNSYERVYNIKELSSKNLLLCGWGGASSMPYLLKADSTGSILWSKSHGINGNNNNLANVELTTDKGYIAGGTTSNGTASETYLIKTDSLGVSGCNEFPFVTGTQIINPIVTDLPLVDSVVPFVTGTIVRTLSSTFLNSSGNCSYSIRYNNLNDGTLSVFPNPSTGVYHMQSKTEIGLVFIYNFLGELTTQLNVKESTASFDISSQPPGIYFLRKQNQAIKLIRE